MIEKSFTVSGRPRIEVRIPSGRVELVEGAPGAVKVTVDTSDPYLTVEQSGDMIVVSTGSNGQRGWSSHRSRVTAEVPSGADALFHTASAGINVAVDLGKAEVKTASGDTDLQNVDTLSAKTASGDVTVDNVAGDLRVNAVSGDVHVKGTIGGTAVVVTVSGGTRIGTMIGDLDVSCVSGGGRIGRFEGRSANFRSVSGDFEVGVPEGTRAHIDCKVSSGKVTLPSTPSAGGEIQREMTIKAKSVSGDLRIDRVGA